MSLDWNRTAKPKILVKADEISSSLYSAGGGAKLGKSQYLYLALLMEATRFIDVSYCINNGQEISKTQLDWADQAKEGRARVLKVDMEYEISDTSR